MHGLEGVVTADGSYVINGLNDKLFDDAATLRRRRQSNAVSIPSDTDSLGGEVDDASNLGNEVDKLVGNFDTTLEQGQIQLKGIIGSRSG